jgi:hypothetical protein
LRGFDGKAVDLPACSRKSKSPTRSQPKAEVVADFQMLHAQAVDQDGIDELIGAELAQALVEGQAQHPVDAFGSQQLQLVAQAGQTGRRGVRGENSRGCGSKITTQLGTPNSSARSRSRARIAWWPR